VHLADGLGWAKSHDGWTYGTDVEVATATSAAMRAHRTITTIDEMLAVLTRKTDGASLALSGRFFCCFFGKVLRLLAAYALSKKKHGMRSHSPRKGQRPRSSCLAAAKGGSQGRRFYRIREGCNSR
jgi:hypothetical protein